MRIQNHLLAGARQVPSPNHGGRFGPGAPDTLVLHYTACDDADLAVRILSDPAAERRVSAHLVVGRDGEVTQLLPFDTIAWHAGRSAWGGRVEFNRMSLGVEIDNSGRLEERGEGVLVSRLGRVYRPEEAVHAVHRNESEPAWWLRYPRRQLEVVEALSAALVAEYGLRWILGHEEIAPDRKDDPGPAFPLDELRDRIPGGSGSLRRRRS